MNSNKELIDYLVNSGVLETPIIIAAFLAIDRIDFVQADTLSEAYGDYPLPIGKGQTISQPTVVSMMLETLAPQEGEKILDVGCGSGWTTALLANIVGPKGKVIGLDRIPELVRFGQENLTKYDLPQAEIRRAAKDIGLAKESPFDRILVSAAAEQLPTQLIDQLKPGGRLVIPIQSSLWQIDKDLEGNITRREFPGFVFVPLK